MNAKDTERSADLAGWRRIIEHLPPTLRPMLSQRLNGWELLFPFEQNEVGRFFRGANTFSPDALQELTANLRSLEAKMGVAKWSFFETSNTMEDSALLARSAYFSDWRAEVQRIYAAIESHEPPKSAASSKSLVLILLPESLPIDPVTAWKWWEPDGQALTITGECRNIANLLLAPDPQRDGAQIAEDSNDSTAMWLIDAEDQLEHCVSSFSAVSLSYTSLNPFRQRFLAELNTIPKDMTGADKTMARLRATDWARWTSPEVAGDPRLLHFLIEVFLSGNGALIFPSAFVEWTASEALRRARPRVLAARFGMRSKPKPFTSIAIFENQERVSSSPTVDDPVNSAIDAAILARYVWLAASRHREYGDAICLCVSEHLKTARLIAPSGSGLENLRGAVSGGSLSEAIRAWQRT